MAGVLTGFVVIGVVIGVGYLAARRGVLPEGAQVVLAQTSFRVATPALLFTVLADADLGQVFSGTLWVTSVAALACAAVVVAAGVVRRWGTGRTTIAALAAGMVNSANLGIPIAVHVLGDAALVAPLLLFQLVVLVPAAVVALDLSGPADGTPRWVRLTAPFRNPVLIASVLGLLVGGAGWTVPSLVLDPLELLASLAVPAVLLAYGISLHGAPLPGRGPDRRAVLLASALKLLLMPASAWALATALGIGGEQLFVVVVLSALPTAQNVYTYAVAYRTAERLAQQTVTVTTAGSVPVLLLVAALLGP
ncbi:AEC family transporter [Klenkia sp. LSe6-5]|uniref:AEC family transporter n=1 Tax=Klenkia sesuvii TaxID=3103137 RepID=A0ABU8DR69_9ACTN